MNDNDLLKIINHYGILAQLKKFHEEVFELIEAIITNEEGQYGEYWNEQYEEHIVEEIADVMVMLSQFKEYYEIDGTKIMDIMKKKVDRQLRRIKSE